MAMLGRSLLPQAPTGVQVAQPRPCNLCPSAHTAAVRAVVASSAYSQAAALQPSDSDTLMNHNYGVLQKSSAHQQQVHAGFATVQQQQRLGHVIRRCNTFSQLLSILQQHGKVMVADDVTAMLYKAAMLAKSAKRLYAVNSAANSSRGRSRKLPYSADDLTAAQQIVGDCLQSLLQVNQQLTAQHLSNCLLSLSVLCSRGGPAAATFNGSSSSTGASSADAMKSDTQPRQQQQQKRGAGVLQQLIAPASSRALDQLLEATAPQHHLQQLLELTCTAGSNSSSSSLCLHHAELHQLVNSVYGLAVLRVRPAPQVLQQMLYYVQQRLVNTQQHQQHQQQRLVPKLLSQLLWSAATLQLQLPVDWLSTFWSTSQPLLPLYAAQDIANTAWAAATLRLQPPAAWLSDLRKQVQALSGNMTGQGLANTLWGLAVVDAAAVPGDLLLQLVHCATAAAKRGRLDAQNLANIVWAVAKCAKATAGSSRTSGTSLALRTAVQQLLSSSSTLAPSFHPQDWSNILWACGQLQLPPDASLLQQLWRRTPAGFNTSLNPHNMIKMTRHQATTWSPQALANCLWGCARIKAQPTRVWMQGFEAASVSLLTDFSPQLLSNTLWACGQLGYTPSDAWLQQYWQCAGGVVQELQTAVAAAAAADGVPQQHHDYTQSHDTWHDEEVHRQGMNTAASQVVMVMQAAGRLGVVPPVHWMQQATAAMKAAVEVSINARANAGLQELRAGVFMRTLAAFLHSLSRLQQTAVSRASNSLLISTDDVRSMLQYALCSRNSSSSIIIGDSLQKQLTIAVPGHLSSLEALLLLSAVPQLPLGSRQEAAQAAAVLVARCYQILIDSSSSSSGDGCGESVMTSKQVVEYAVSAARAVRHCCRRGMRNNSSTGVLHPVHTSQFWNSVQAVLPPPHDLTTNNNHRVLLALCSKLEQHLSDMSAADISRALTAVAQLHSISSSSSGCGSNAPSLSSFTTSAGNAVCDHMGVMLPHQRAAAAASLAQLGYIPGTKWLELLLLHSGCQLSSDQCRIKDKLMLLQSLPVLLQRHSQHQQQQQQLSTAVHTHSQGCVEGVTGWLQDWLGESVGFLNALDSQQLLVVAAAMHKLLRYLQQQQQSVVLPAAWRAAYLSAVVQLLPDVAAPELVALLSSAARLQLRPSHEWCAVVAGEAAARAATMMNRRQQQQTDIPSSSSNSNRRKMLKVHHVALLAYSFRKLGYKPPWSIRQTLLDYVLAECRRHSSRSSSDVVTPQQVMQLLFLLPLCGWYPTRNWLRYFKRIRAVRQLRLYLSKKRHRGSWRVLERRFRCWEQIKRRST